MSRRTSSRLNTASFCLFLAYTLLVSFIAPFGINRVEAAPAPSPTTNANAPASAENQSQGNNRRRGRRKEGELLVRFRQGVSEADKTRVVEARGARRGRRLRGRSRLEKIALGQGQNLDTIADLLKNLPEIERVEPNYLIEKQGTMADDPRFGEQWHLRNTSGAADIRATDAWDATTGSTNTVIAIVDSGIDFAHPDLANNQWTKGAETANNNADDDHNGLMDDRNGWDWIAGNGEIRDGQGHGTALAGIIAAQGNNQQGISGVMWRASLMSLRVLDNTGTGTVGDAVEAIDYAIDNGAQIINCSWGTPEESLILKDAVERANQRGVVIVASAGNDASDDDQSAYYPASYDLPNLISVASTTNSDQLAATSNWGATKVTIAAPGTNILTTKKSTNNNSNTGEYQTVNGTSAAAAVVSGVVGLIRTLRPRLNADATKQMLVQNVRQASALNGKVQANGIVQASLTVSTVVLLPQGTNQSDNNNDGGHAGGREDYTGNNNGNDNNAHPPIATPTPGRGTGGDFTTAPPQGTAPQMPNLEQVKRTPRYDPKAPQFIHANSVLPPCDADCGDSYSQGLSGSSDPNFATERIRPQNETGSTDLGSRNFNWSTGLVGLSGRAGMDLSVALNYNSLVWTKGAGARGNYIQYNRDQGFPGAGFTLGLPHVEFGYYNYEDSTQSFLMITPSGGRVEFRQVATNVFEATDGSYSRMEVTGTNQYGGISSVKVLTSSGTQMSFSIPAGNYSGLYCTEIIDRNGNKITAVHNSLGRPEKITDTLGREINFNYEDGYLKTITQTGRSLPWATFSYGTLTIETNFTGTSAYGMPNGREIPVLTQVGRADGSSTKFEYNTYGQVYKITNVAADSSNLSYTEYEFNTNQAQTDCPRFTQRKDWAREWNNGLAVTTSYSVAADGSATTVTAPDGTQHKELFSTTVGWQKGLTTGTETWVNGSKVRWTTVEWTQDDTNLTYQKNPRVVASEVHDSGNAKRTTIEYTSAAEYRLPQVIREFNGTGTGATLLRKSETYYRFDNEFINRRIIGLPSVQKVFAGESTLLSYVEYHYDWDNHYNTSLAPSVGYVNPNLLYGRGNVVGILRRDVNDVGNDAKRVAVSLMKYDMAGQVIEAGGDNWTNNVRFDYADSFEGGANPNTRAFPTKVTDADNNFATTQYDYLTGRVTRATDAKGVVQTFAYKSDGKPEQVTTLDANNNPYTYIRWAYPASMAHREQFATIEAGQGEAYTVEFYDGAGRVKAVAGELPSSAGGWWAQHIKYDGMGRAYTQTNPSEITGGWSPTGDDAGGWVWTNQAYDWKGRPTVATSADGTTTEASYAGCGCAGGDVTTVRDERGRRKKYTNDTLGRLIKTEELNWNQSVYSTADYAYNMRDQLTSITHNGQPRTFSYDGHGRLISKSTPEQGTQTFTYNANDSLATSTDARGVIAAYGYNNRGLVTGVSYSNLPSGVAGANTTFAYDSVGNRIQMNDQSGSTVYTYNWLSQLQSETRGFAGLGGSYSLSYTYNIGGQLKSVANPWGSQVTYAHDKLGRVTSVNGAGPVSQATYASSLQYRVFGALKSQTFGNNKQFSAAYDSRLRMTQWNVAGVMGWDYDYTLLGENTGRVTYARNMEDATLDRAYDYDQVGRLVVARTGVEARNHVSAAYRDGNYGAYSHNYNYDASGNQTFREGWGGTFAGGIASQTTTFTNNRMNQHPLTGQSLAYDQAGNLTSDGNQTFQYDATGQQTYASSYGLQQSYDGDRLRVKKVENGQAKYYLRSSILGGQVIAEINQSGGWTKGFVYGAGGELLAIQEGAISFVHQDPVTKSQRITNASGGVASGVDLDPWGGETNKSFSLGTHARKYTTYDRDANGDDEAQQRKYKGNLMRFTQPDPYSGSMSLADPQSFNRYAYVGNDPVNFVDPSGLNMCPAEYGSCGGGWDGRGGADGAYGSGFAGGLFDSTRFDVGSQAEADYEQRVNNAIGGNGFRTNEEYMRALGIDGNVLASVYITCSTTISCRWELQAMAANRQQLRYGASYNSFGGYLMETVESNDSPSSSSQTSRYSSNGHLDINVGYGLGKALRTTDGSLIFPGGFTGGMKIYRGGFFFYGGYSDVSWPGGSVSVIPMVNAPVTSGVNHSRGASGGFIVAGAISDDGSWGAGATTPTISIGSHVYVWCAYKCP